MLEAGESAREAEEEAILFQLENADRLNLSEAKRLQLKIQLLKIGQQEAKQDKKKAQDDEKQRKDEITQLIANSNNAEEALEKKVRAEASNALASLVRSVFESQPFPLNIALAGGVAVAGTKAIDWAIGQAKGIKLRQGGFIEGFGGGDRVPAMLEQGEFVLNKEAVQNIGINNLSELNAGKNGGGMNIVFNAPVTNEDFVKDFIVPTIRESQERNLS